MATTSYQEDRISRALEQAARVDQAQWQDERCSCCERLVPDGNFCARCGATFLTYDDIFARRLRKPLGGQ